MEEEEVGSARRNMLAKWFIIPYSILVIMGAGAPYNLQEHWKFFLEEPGFLDSAENYTLLAVMSGYYFGALGGIIIHRLDTKHAYGIAAIMTFVGHVGIGISVKFMDIGILSISLTILFFFIISFGASLAMMSAIITPLECFDRYASFLIIGLLVGYIKITPVFERAIKKSWFRNIAGQVQSTDDRIVFDENIQIIYHVAIGIVVSIIYLIGGFFESNFSSPEKYESVIRSIEKMGLYIFTLLEGVLIFVIYFMGVENHNPVNNLFVILAVLGSNFLVYLVAYLISLCKLSNYTVRIKPFVPEKGMDSSFLIVIKDPKFIGLFLSSLFVIGTSSSTYYFLEKERINNAQNKMKNLEPFFDNYWLLDALGRIFGGVNAYLFTKIFPKFFFAILGTLAAGLGFSFLIAFELFHYSSLMHLGIIGIGSACGIWWVIAPIIILDDIGLLSFDIVWGITLSISFLGLFFYTIVFNLVWVNISQSLTIVYSISLISGFISLPMCLYSYNQERKEKPLKLYPY